MFNKPIACKTQNLHLVFRNPFALTTEGLEKILRRLKEVLLMSPEVCPDDVLKRRCRYLHFTPI